MDDKQINALITSLENIQSKREDNFNSSMAKIKFQSKVATVSDEKCSDAYIDSGATHHFFDRKSSFITFERIEPESVKAASSTSKLVRKGTIKLPFDNGTIIEAYPAPEFSSNIISVQFLLKTYKVEFSENEQGTAFFFVYQKEPHVLIAKIQEVDLLFPLKLKNYQNH